MDYKLEKNCLSSDAVNLLYHTIMMHKLVTYDRHKVKQSNTTAFGDEQVPHSFGFYGMPFTDCLLFHLQKKVELFADRPLFPTCTYGRISFTGAELKKHTDRAACQFSATVCIHNDPEPWPIFMDGKKFVLEPGDVVFYKGIKVPHWREPFTGKRQVQVFLHYVDSNGPFKEMKYDRRPFLGYPAIDSSSKE